MWSALTESVESEKVIRYHIFYRDTPLTFSEMIRRWCKDKYFVSFFSQTLAEVPWPAYFWEMPSLHQGVMDCTAEFVLLKSSSLAQVASDPDTFREHYGDTYALVISFKNLGGDALLVVPVPRANSETYSHLAAFVRNAPPQDQLHLLWQHLGHRIMENLDERPLWVSTSGLGVHWLHIRLDSSPKYYHHLPYCSIRKP